MIDLGQLRDDPAQIVQRIKKKDPSFNADRLAELDQQVRSLRLHVEALRHKKNELAQEGKKGVTPELREQSISIGRELKESEEKLSSLEQEFMQLYMRCPNLPADDLPEVGKEANKVVSVYGNKPEFNFPVKNHLELGTDLHWFNWHAAATTSGSGFVFYQDEAVKLLYALTMFMLKHNMDYGYRLVFPPYVTNEKSLEVASNFPKFREEVYAVTDDKLYLIPTAEVSLANMHREAIFKAEELPLRYTAATSCFRREAGGYGASERGLIRVHQFEKAELFTYCLPEDSEKELERMLECAESILQKLGLHYRVSLLAAQDCSFPSAKTYDIEIWMPGQHEYKEVSSCSNCTDFQARRGLMRYRSMNAGKTHLVHTLNGSSLALPRLVAALMETYQQPDGTIYIPDVLKGYGFY
jgi:seryl-tRNA synthetase